MIAGPSLPPGSTRSIFISYARRDGSTLAQQLRRDLAKQGFDAWLDTERIGGGAVWTRSIETALDGADCMLALCTTGSYRSEICRAEQLRALRKGRRVIPLLAEAGSDIPLHLEAKNYRDFSDPGRYRGSFAELLRDIRSSVSATLPASYRKTNVTYLTAPPKVANYLERPEALRALRDAIFEEDRRQPIALTALAGMGGIGKTVLAKALTDDEIVQQAFPDGIVWITAGKERQRDFTAEMREVGKALGDDPAMYDTPLAAQNRYRTILADKAALIVVDDVWSKADVEPLLVESPRSRFLFTTRDASLANFLGVKTHLADLLDRTRARALLAAWADVSAEQLPDEADDLVDECGRLPLALSVVGAMLRGAGRKSWADTLALLRGADLSAIQERLPEGQQSFFKAVEVSFRALSEKMQARYRALGAWIEDLDTPLGLLQVLWNVDEAEARSTCRHFVERSLAAYEGGSESIRLHDLQLDYVRAQCPDVRALDLIRGAVRLSANVITRDPAQFTSQMVGRLISHRDNPVVAEFIDAIVAGTRIAWLRAERPALHPPGTALIRTLRGHSDKVETVALSAKGRVAVSASRDDTVRIWDVSSGRLLQTLEGPFDDIEAVALSADGRIAIVAYTKDNDDDDETHVIEVWDAENGRALRLLEGRAGWVRALALSADGTTAISASTDDDLIVWDVNAGRARRRLKSPPDGRLLVALSGDARVALSARARERALAIWDVKTGRKLRSLAVRPELVEEVSLSRDGTTAIAACRRDNDDDADDDSKYALKVWEVATGKEVSTIPTAVEHHSGVIYNLALSGDGKVVCAPMDKTVRIWETATGNERPALRGHSDDVNAVAISDDGRIAVSASDDRSLKVWRLEGGAGVEVAEGHSGGVVGLAVTSDGRLAISAAKDETLGLWDAESGMLRASRDLRGEARSMTASADGRTVVVACKSRWEENVHVELWDVEGDRKLPALEGYAHDLPVVALSPDGRTLVGAFGVNVRVWDLPDGRQRTWKLPGGRKADMLYDHDDETLISAVAVSADGHTALSGTFGRELRLWDLEAGRHLRTLTGHTDRITAVGFNRDARLAISAADDRTIRIWEIESGRTLRTLTGHSDSVNCAALSPDGRLVVSASTDQTVRVWELDTGAALAAFTCEGSALSCAFVERQRIVAGDEGGRVYFLHLEPASTNTFRNDTRRPLA